MIYVTFTYLFEDWNCFVCAIWPSFIFQILPREKYRDPVAKDFACAISVHWLVFHFIVCFWRYE